MTFESKIRPIYWENCKSKMIDQTVIPYEYKYIDISSGDDMFNAIRNMKFTRLNNINKWLKQDGLPQSLHRFLSETCLIF